MMEYMKSTTYAGCLTMCASKFELPPYFLLRCTFSLHFSFVLLNLDPSVEWGLRESGTKIADQIITLIEAALADQRASTVSQQFISRYLVISWVYLPSGLAGLLALAQKIIRISARNS
jgi:hypothetical protein